jgi:hypothetical protein
MALTELSVAHPDKDSDSVAVYAFDGWQSVVAIIPKIHLQHHFHRSHLTHEQAALLVSANIEPIGRVMTVKYQRGEFSRVSTQGAPRVIYFKLDDIERESAALTDGVLTSSAARLKNDGNRRGAEKS